MRLTLLVTVCVAAAVIGVSVITYVATERRLVGAVDETLGGRAQFVTGGSLGLRGGGAGDFREGAVARPELWLARRGLPSVDIFQVVSADGRVLLSPQDQVVRLPVSNADLDVARGDSPAYFRTTTLDGEEYRVLATRGPENTVILAGRSLAEVNDTLRGLRVILIVVSVVGVVAAAAVGLFVAHRSLRPVRKLTAATEHIAATQDLSHSIDVVGNDEIGRLATSFNAMLSALAASKQQQSQLIADASHELRTPLTSLRTNIELLSRDKAMDDAERQQILQDASAEVVDLAATVSELLALAADEQTDREHREEIQLDAVVTSVVERARRRGEFDVRLSVEPAVVMGNYALVERAIRNLLDNAAKWSPAGGRVDVVAADGVVTVRDYGTGFSKPDLPHVFDRFFRSAEARSKPGSGLGLAIVKQVAESHGGWVRAENAPGGGARVTMSLQAVSRRDLAPSWQEGASSGLLDEPLTQP